MSDTDTSVGGSAMLELKMKGYPRPQMKWTKDGQAITAGDRFKFIYPDQESAALIINKVFKNIFVYILNILCFSLVWENTRWRIILSL